MSCDLQEDRPITIKDDKGNTSKLIAEIVALFITAMDKLKLDIRSMDDLHAELKVKTKICVSTAAADDLSGLGRGFEQTESSASGLARESQAGLLARHPLHHAGPA